MAHQVAVTVHAPLRQGGFEAIACAIGTVVQGDGTSNLFGWSGLPSVHFARVTLLEQTTDLDGDVIPASLVYMADVDVSVARHLRDLVSQARSRVDELFGQCAGYPVDPTDDARLAWLTAHSVQPAAYYVHRVGRTAIQISDESLLRADLELMADEEQTTGDAAPGPAYERLRRGVLNRVATAWAAHPSRGPGLLFRCREILHMITVPTVVVVGAPILLPLAIAGVLIIRLKESTDRPEAGQVDFAHLEAVRAHEDFGAQNPLTAVGLVKPGIVRTLAMRVGLIGLNYANRHVFNRNDLAGVRSIHFARWVPLDGGRRLIFASSYDGSAESYMDDFINQLHWGINLIFSNGVGFPRTRWLIHGGAQDEIAYKNFLGRHQIPTPVFYSAYPELTAVTVDANSDIRDGVSTSLQGADRRRWLCRL